MKRINHRGLCMGFVVLAGLLAAGFANAQSTMPPTLPTNVNVVNKPTVKVESLPAVTINGTPTVNVNSLPEISGAVSITNSPTVLISNAKTAPANVLDVERVARIPYESTQTASGYPQEMAVFPAPPSGYRLVLQHVSVTLLMNSGSTQLPWLVIYPNDNSYVGRASFIGKVGGIGSQTFGAFNEDLLSYWDSTDAPPLVVMNGDFYNGAVNFVTLSGYLEKCSVTGCPSVKRW